MLIRKCDKCGEEIKGNYWTIEIYEKEDEYGCHTTEGSVNNALQNFEKSKEYCFDCIKKIKKYLEEN